MQVHVGHRRSIAAEPWGCLTKPVAKIIVWPMLISGILTAEIQIGEEAIHAIAGLGMQLTVGTADPAADTAISIGKFLKQDPFLQ